MDSLVFIILNYKSCGLTISLVKHLVLLNEHFKIVIVDNNSMDDSSARFREEFSGKSNLLLVELEKNEGYSNGNNEGIFAALTKWESIKYIAILNPDVWIDNLGVISTLIEDLENDRFLAFIKPKMYICGKDCDISNSGWNIDGGVWRRIFMHCKIWKRKDSSSINECVGKLCYVDALHGSFFIAKRSVFEEIGLFDNNIFLYGEESILAIKLKKYNPNYRMAIDLSIQYDHRHSPDNKNKDYNKVVYKSLKYMLLHYYEAKAYQVVLFTIFQWPYSFIFVPVKRYIKGLLKRDIRK